MGRTMESENVMSKLQDAGIALCDNVPCFWAITPGVTPIKEAEAIIDYQGEINQTGSIHRIRFTTDALWGSLIVIPDNPIVVGIEITPRQMDITLKEFVELIGEPCAVHPVPANRVNRYFMGIMFESPLIRFFCQDIKDDDASIADAPITLLLFASPPMVGRGMTPDPCDRVNNPEQFCTNWHGFISLNEYRRFIK